MRTNKIIEYGLESRCKKLKEDGLTEQEIADKLTVESKQPISKAGVNRFLTSLIKDKQAVIDRSDKLKAKVIEAELDTVNARQEIIKELREMANKAMDKKDYSLAIVGLHRAIIALDSLDKRLGRFMSNQSVQVNLNQAIQINQEFNEFMKIVLEEVNIDDRKRIVAKLSQYSLY